jgi:hypothetical protein
MGQELLNKIKILEHENEKLKKQLENYNNSRKAYYENNKEIVNQKAKELGYEYEIWVYDNKGNKIEIFI